QIGDAVIIDLTQRISKIIRTGDVLARYGGEEFGLILPESNKDGANTLAMRILETISSKPLQVSQKTISYSISIGLATYDGSKPV
ncbi:MAG: GGDEF domain-containing protein, partial [Fibrobacter sp.]|nr:GGDEF domain-containing protein [Fibrobacter sp.]